MKWTLVAMPVLPQGVDRPRPSGGETAERGGQDRDAREHVVHVGHAGRRRTQPDHEQVPRVLVAVAGRRQHEDAVPLEVREARRGTGRRSRRAPPGAPRRASSWTTPSAAARSVRLSLKPASSIS